MAPYVLLEVDHVIPQCQGGKDIPSNGLTACYECNHGKMGRTIEEMINRITRKKPNYHKVKRNRNEEAGPNDPVKLTWLAKIHGTTHGKALTAIKRGTIEGSRCNIAPDFKPDPNHKDIGYAVPSSRILTKEDFFK